MNSLISWVGGKKSIRDLIYARFPQSYGRYIEVFGGGGWVLFGKKPDKFEVYNDFNNNLSNMFAVVRDQPLAFIQELGYLPENGRNIFNLYKEIITKQRVEDKFLQEEMEKVKVYFTELLGFGIGFFAPSAGDDVIRHAVLHQVHGDHGELQGSAALDEKDLIVVGDVHQLPQVRFSLVHDGLKDLGAVAHFHDAHAGTFVVEHLGGDLLQHRFGQHAGACGEIVDTTILHCR